MPLFIVCPDCQHKNKAENSYCEMCGKPLPDLASQESKPEYVRGGRDNAT